MTADPVTRTARRQNLLDRLAEHLTDWGCPADAAATRSLSLLHEVEAHGWQLPNVDAPPLSGRGSTPEGRAKARRIARQVQMGCTCGDERLGWLDPQHFTGCPVRDAHDGPRAAGLPPPSDEPRPAGIPVSPETAERI